MLFSTRHTGVLFPRTDCAGTREAKTKEAQLLLFPLPSSTFSSALTFGLVQRKERRRLAKERRSNGPPMRMQGFQMARTLQDGVILGRAKLGNKGKKKEGVNGSIINRIKRIGRWENPRMECEERNTMGLASSSEFFQMGTGSQTQTFSCFFFTDIWNQVR